MPTNEEKVWAVIAHLAGLVPFFVVPFGCVIVPLMIWLLKKDESAFVAWHAKQSLDFQVSTILASIVVGILVLLFIGWPLLVALWMIGWTFPIYAAVKTWNGEMYKYPVGLNWIK